VRIYQRGDAGESFHSDVPTETLEESTSFFDIFHRNVEADKIVRDGQILIRRGEHFYTITGQKIK
jgi:hypothetical protein